MSSTRFLPVSPPLEPYTPNLHSVHVRMRRLAAVLILMCSLMTGTTLFAIAQGGLTGLYATGVDNSGNPAADSASDLHYTLVSTPGTGGSAVVTQQHWPVGNGAWMPDGNLSKWISPRADESQYLDAPGDYTYQTTFTVTGDPATARITGQAMGDNAVTAIILNGQTVATNVSGGFDAWSSFTLATGFVSGTNTLQFVVRNWTADNTSDPQNNPSGFRCEMTGTASPLPPPPDGLTLTQTGINEGFALTVFASKFPNGNGMGPFGIGFTPTGGVLTSDYENNQFRVFPTDTDGQDATTVPSSSSNGGFGLANLGGKLYMSTIRGAVMQVDVDSAGNITQTTVVEGPGFLTGIAANPATRHLLVADNLYGVIYDIDPLTQTVTTVVQYLHLPDGVAVSGDGSTVYVAAVSGSPVDHIYGDHILGYSLSTGQQVFDSGLLPGADGCAVGTSGALLNKLYVNTNLGEVYEIDLSTKARTLIASGGSRGDLVTIDPDGSLLLTQSDRICRLRNAHGSFNAGLFLNPNSVVGGAPAIATSTATLRMSYTAGPNGQSILLSSSNPVAQVQSYVTLAPNSNQATFPVNTSAVAATTQVLISATDGTESHSATLTLNPTPPPTGSASLSITVGLFSIVGGDDGTGIVTLDAPAPSGGIDVALTSDETAVQVPGTIHIPANAISATFHYTSIPVVEKLLVSLTATSGTNADSTTFKVQPAIDLNAVTTGDGKNTLFWQGVPGAVGYNVYRSLTAAGGYVQLNLAPVNTLDPGPGLTNEYMYSDTGLTNGVQYFYYIASVMPDGSEGVRSDRDSAVPSANAIPWDTGDPAQVMPGIYNIVNSNNPIPDLMTFPDVIAVLGPDHLLYQNDPLGGPPLVQASQASIDPSSNMIYSDQPPALGPAGRMPTKHQNADDNHPKHDWNRGAAEILRKQVSRPGAMGFNSWLGLPPDMSSSYMNLPNYQMRNPNAVNGQGSHTFQDACWITIGATYGANAFDLGLQGLPGRPGWQPVLGDQYLIMPTLPSPVYKNVKYYVKPLSDTVIPEIFVGLKILSAPGFSSAPMPTPFPGVPNGTVEGMAVATIHADIQLEYDSLFAPTRTTVSLRDMVLVSSHVKGFGLEHLSDVTMKRMVGIAQSCYGQPSQNWIHDHPGQSYPGLLYDTPDKALHMCPNRGDFLHGWATDPYAGICWGDVGNDLLLNYDTVQLYPFGQWEQPLTWWDNSNPWVGGHPYQGGHPDRRYVSSKVVNADYWETNIWLSDTPH